MNDNFDPYNNNNDSNNDNGNNFINLDKPQDDSAYYQTPPQQNAQQGYGQQNDNTQQYAQYGQNQNQNQYGNNSQYNYSQQYAQYGQNAYAGYSGIPDTKLATASLVIGIISLIAWPFMFVFPPLFVLPIVGLILGIVHKSKHIPEGKGTSTAGIVLSSISLALPVIAIIIIIAMLPQLLEWLKTNSPEQYQQMYEQYHDQLPYLLNCLQLMIRSLFIR